MSVPQLRPYQIDLFGRVRTNRGNGNRIIVVQAPTGAGKTSWAAFMASEAVAKGKRVLFLVHRRKLVDQISQRLHDFHVDHGTIMRGDPRDGGAAVQVASRDTLLSRYLNQNWHSLPPADLVIVDEGHRAHAPDSEYRRILENYPHATIILLTATPVGPDGSGLGPWAEGIECSDPVTKLIKDGYLLPFKCYAPARKVKNGKAKRGIAGDLVESWKQYAEDQPTVLFTGRVAHSQDAVAEYRNAGIAAEHVDADTSDEDRDRIYDGLESGKVKVVSNVGIIKEGVDIPCLGCVQVYMDMNGRVAWLQACGRVMRPHANKKYAILIDHAACVYKHGFPDEDTEWTLEGNTDAEFKKKHDDGLTKKVMYCGKCEMTFSGLACPNCGRVPTKPPRSIFAPPPIDSTNELLVEADRQNEQGMFSRKEKEQTWFGCLMAGVKRGLNFKACSSIYKRKYGDWPPNDMPMMPDWSERGRKVSDVYPNFGKKKGNNGNTD